MLTDTTRRHLFRTSPFSVAPYLFWNLLVPAIPSSWCRGTDSSIVLFPHLLLITEDAETSVTRGLEGSGTASSSTIKEQEISTPRKNGQAEVPACVHCPRSLLASEMRRRQVLMGEKPNPQQTEALWSAVTAKHSNVSLFLAGRIQKSCCIYCCSLL